MLAVDLRFPNPKLFRREFLELIWKKEGKRGKGSRCADEGCRQVCIDRAAAEERNDRGGEEVQALFQLRRRCTRRRPFGRKSRLGRITGGGRVAALGVGWPK